ncbi:MlaE family ABC transporter permease [Chryseosolibacter indicus]|uniref:ABC transporter permease n=1 Tax=Chryseosolibacter indicus TaxID=2782351 RepID=A0ABS5VK56_9BACT|nr:ABC transporter permease [Chryseosolibacter indicus]MBT1701766.1 ABC transporter permease [Chryseosolibacter indicus]
MDIKKGLVQVAEVSTFTKRVFRDFFFPPYEVKEIIRQCFMMGNKSLFLITFTSFLVGIVFTKQSRPSLASFGAESWLPSLVAQAVVRSLGPLVTGLICAGKLGSNIGAELGSMQVTEQIDAMEVSGTRPFSYLVVSRITATTLMLPLLVVYSDILSLLGSFLTVNIYNNTSFQLFFNEVAVNITYTDIFSSLIKSAFFGFAIGLVGCYSGYHSDKGTTGVGKAANTSVVVSMMLIFVIDLLSIQFINLFR